MSDELQVGDDISWPILAVKTHGKWFYHIPSEGNGTCGAGWFMAYPWGEKRERIGMIQDNRVGLDDIEEVILLGWTRPMQEYIAEFGRPFIYE